MNIIEAHVASVDMEPVAWINDDHTLGPNCGRSRLSFDKYHSLDPLRYTHTPLHTAEQLAAVRHRALEEAAVMCEKEAMNWPPSRDFKLCAAAIRAAQEANKMTIPELGRMSMADCPAFEHWQRHDINQWAQSAYDRLIAQEDTIAQLRLDLKNAMAQLDKDDWK